MDLDRNFFWTVLLSKAPLGLGGWVGRWTDRRSSSDHGASVCQGPPTCFSRVFPWTLTTRPRNMHRSTWQATPVTTDISLYPPFPWSDSGFFWILAPIASVFKECWSLSFAKKVTNSTTHGWLRRCQVGIPHISRVPCILERKYLQVSNPGFQLMTAAVGLFLLFNIFPHRKWRL